jgi:tetratricopeptide (TPR) repeat protein
MDFNDYFQRGKSFLERRDYGPAIENFEAALRLDPGNTKLQYIIGEAKMCAQEKAQAEYYESQAREARAQLNKLGGNSW